MDAVTLVAAAVAVAIDNSHQAALNDLLLERERAAMRAADLECQAAQRGHVGNQQLPRPRHVPTEFYTRTWRDAYNRLDTEYQQTLTRVGVANSLGNGELVAQLVREELGFDPQPTESESESEPEEGPPAEPSDLDAPACAVCGDRRNVTVVPPIGAFAGADRAARTLCLVCYLRRPRTT